MPEDNKEPDDMSLEAISRALHATRARVARAERERAEIDRTIAAAREEERLLDRLLVLRRDGGSDISDDGERVEPQRHQSQTLQSEGGHPIIIAVIQELETAGRPLHISELMRLLRDRNVAIPGSGTQANLITYLRRDERFVRPSRGMYGLRIWGLSSMPATRRRRRRRKRMRSAASDDGRAGS